MTREILWTPLSASTLATLEEEFFDLLWRCDSTSLTRRDAATRELTRRFWEFEPIWSDRAFLTDGEIGCDARLRFERAEEETRLASLDAAKNAFAARIDFAETKETRESLDAPADGTNDAASERRLGTLNFSWDVPLRLVWLAPILSDCATRDAGTNALWIPSSRFSTPELQPDFDAQGVGYEAYFVRGEEPTPGEFDEGILFDVVAGAEPRPLALAFPASEERVYRSLGLTVAVSPLKIEGAQCVATIALNYDGAFDAFDSHRVWYDRLDFALAPDAEESRLLVPDAATRSGRTATGERVELRFTLEEEVDASRARLICALPRFFVGTRLLR